MWGSFNSAEYDKLQQNKAHACYSPSLCRINALLEERTDARDVTLLRSLTQLIDLGTCSPAVTGGLGGTCA